VRDLAQTLLADPARRLAVARCGYATVARRHGPRQRGEAFAAWLAGQPLDRLVADRLAARARIRRDSLRLLYLHWAEALAGDARAGRYLDEIRAWNAENRSETTPGRPFD